MDKQRDFFIKNNLDRDAGVHLINQTCMNLFNKEYSEHSGKDDRAPYQPYQ